MHLRIKAIVSSALMFLVLTFVLGSVHYELFKILPQEGFFGTIAECFLLLLALLPALISGFIAGYMSRNQGIVIGAISVSIAAVALFGALGTENWSQQLVSVVLGGVAGGCGEFLAVKNIA